jgi:hypothetical protein
MIRIYRKTLKKLKIKFDLQKSKAVQSQNLNEDVLKTYPKNVSWIINETLYY